MPVGIITNVAAVVIGGILGCLLGGRVTERWKKLLNDLLGVSAMTMGIDGVFMEVHKDPDHAMSDGPNQVYLKDLEKILSNLMLVRKAYQQMATI